MATLHPLRSRVPVNPQPHCCVAERGRVINGNSALIAHFGDPIGIVKAPMIYNPWFDSVGIDAARGADGRAQRRLCAGDAGS